MMVWHHLYCIPERLNNNFITLFVYQGYPIETKIAWFCKLCVAIYAFISGYGMYYTCTKIHQNDTKKILLTDYKKVIKHLWGFFLKYWLVFFSFIPIGFLYFDRNFDRHTFFLSLLGQSSAYNGEWWYVEKYIQMLIIFPVLDFCVNIVEKKFQKKKGTGIFLIAGMGSILYFLLKVTDYQVNGYNIYIIIFMEGYLVARYHIFSYVQGIFKRKIILNLTAIFGIIGIAFFRNHYTLAPDYADFDWIYGPILIYCVIILGNNPRVDRYIGRILKFFGKYSIYIWLTHTFFAYYYIQWFILLPRYTVLIYLWLLVISVLTAIILESIYNLIKKFIEKRKRSYR